MFDLIIRRCLVVIPTLFLVSVIVFGMQKLLPGDPVLALAGEDRDPQTIAFLQEKYRLNDPVITQYVSWLGRIMVGDFGISIRTEKPVLELILQKLPVTLQLAAFAMVIALLIGVPAGIISAVRKGTLTDYSINIAALSGLSIPNFWLGILLILVVSVQWQLLPSSGYTSPLENLGQNIRTMIMPAFVLGTGLAGVLMRHTRSAMLSVLRSDYVRTARAKGLNEKTVILRHALRNALVPIITLTTILFGELLAGAVLTEQIFTIPGFGKLIVDAVFTRDYAIVQGVVLCTAVGFILMNLIADILYIVVNPKLRDAT